MLNQTDHGDVSWWTLSEGWPETNENAYAKFIFANKANGLIPYGSYVLGDAEGILRVETQELLDKLNENFNIVKKAILKETEYKSDDWQIGDYVRYAFPHGSYGQLISRNDHGDGFYVKWCYGLDNYGRSMYATSSMKRSDLMKISKEEYDAHVNRPKDNQYNLSYAGV